MYAIDERKIRTKEGPDLQTRGAVPDNSTFRNTNDTPVEGRTIGWDTIDNHVYTDGIPMVAYTLTCWARCLQQGVKSGDVVVNV